MAAPPFDPKLDPLSGNLRQRYLQSYWDQAGPGTMSAPDMNWGPWWQAVGDAAGGRAIKMAGSTSDDNLPSTLWSPEQSSAVTGADRLHNDPVVAAGTSSENAGTPSLAGKRLKRAVAGINNAGGVPSSGPFDQTSQTT